MNRFSPIALIKYLCSLAFFRTYAAWLALPIMATIFGYLATTQNPLMIGLAISAFAGIYLLKEPALNTEFVIFLGLFFAGLAPLYFEGIASKLVWGISILGFMLMISALYRLVTVPHTADNTPIFVWLALFFIMYSVLDSFLQFYSAKEVIGGIKRYFQVWGLIFALCWMGYGQDKIERWRNMVLMICLSQFPFCLYQRVVYVPIRESYVESIPGLEPIDVVAGTFGAALLSGGNTAEMAASLIVIFGFLLARFKLGVISSKTFFTISLILLTPLFMGETKIVVILFPMSLFALYRRELLAKPHYAVMAMIFTVLFVAIAMNAYMIINKMTLDELVFDTLKYNVYEVGYGNYYLNRTTVLTFWSQHQSWANPIGFLFGNGIGSAQVGDGGAEGGHMDILHSNYGIGFTAIAMLLWELGIVGVILFWSIMITAWGCANRIIKVAVDPAVRADALAIQGAMAIFSFYPLYLGSVLSEFPFQAIFACMLGYLAWLYKQFARHKHHE